MFIGYSMPAVNAVNLSAGSAWLTTDNGSALFDGKPARATRLSRSSGSPTINVTLASAIVVRLVGLLGLNLPEGVVVSVGASSATTTRLADGTVACWLLLPVAAATAAVSVVITTAQATVQIGELVIMPAVEVPLGSDWGVERIDPSESVLSVASQVGTNPRQPYRRLTANISIDSAAAARGGGLANGMDWDRLGAALTQDKRCVAIPRTTDAAEIARTAIYGTGRLGQIQHLGGDYYSTSLMVAESPAIA